MEESKLSDFPPVPCLGSITIAEYGAQLISLPSTSDPHNDALEFCNKLCNYHKIDAKNWEPKFQHRIRSIPTSNINSLLITRNEGIVKGMWDSWRDHRWRGLQEYLEEKEKDPVTTVFYRCLAACHTISDQVKMLRHATRVFFYPHMGLQPDVVIEQAVRVRNWRRSWVRAMSWHPNYSRLAIALQDDSVRICSVGYHIMPLLRFAEQKKVTCISWRPCTDLQLAIGVELGIVIWNLQISTSIKPGACKARIISKPNHAPVTSVQYSRTGLLMLSSSSFDATIYVWDVSTWEPTALHRFGGGGVPFASWSPMDNRILSTSPSTLFRIWDGAKMWAPHRWNTPNSPVEAACWNNDGTTLLFASGGMIYALHFVVNAIDKFINQRDCVSVPVYDLSVTYHLTEDEELEYKVGGRVRQMDMDPTGNRMAIFFDDSELVAVFRVQARSMYYLAPCGFIRGGPEEFPLAMQFQNNFKDGSLLTIAWSSGRLQYVPFLFAHSGEVRNFLHQDNYRVPSSLRKATDRKSFLSKRTPQRVGDENEFHPSASFRSNSFIEPPKNDGFESDEFIPLSPSEPMRLFSLTKPKDSL